MRQLYKGGLRTWTCLCVYGAVVAGTVAFVAPGKPSRVSSIEMQPIKSPALDRSTRVIAGAKTVLGLRDCLLTNLDVDPVEDVGRTITLEALELPGYGPVDLTFWEHSTRSSKNYQVLEHRADGSLVPVEPGAIRTVQGEVHGHVGSLVSGSLMEDGLYLTIIVDGYRGWIEPIGDRVQDAEPDEYVAYNNDDVIPSGGTCGTPDQPAKPVQQENPGITNRSASVGSLCVAELGIDADFEFYQDYSSSTSNVESRVNQVINTMNSQYQLEVGLTHEITTIIVRTSSGSNPYSSNNAETLLSQFRSEWLNNQSGVAHDTAQLFTGRSIDGGTIGIAWTIAGICTNSRYSLCESDCCGSFACTTDLHAHELGHLWGGFHCSCTSNTMNPSITCSNTFNDTETIPSLVAHRDSRNCLSGTCGEPGGEPPANNGLFQAIVITDGATSFSTIGATTDGVDHGAGGICDDSDEANDGTVNNDIWYRYTATCDGTATFSTCGTVDFDTKIAAYSSWVIPGTGNIIGCSDDASGCSDFSSRLTLSVSSGDQILIRLGGHIDDPIGSGTLNVSCSGGSGSSGACCVDLDCSVVASEAACSATGGNWQGEGTSCETGTCGTGPGPNVLDLTDLCSWDNLGDADNQSWIIDLGVGAEVTGFSWDDILIETVASNSWSSDIGILVADESQQNGFYYLPFSGQADGGPEDDGTWNFTSVVSDPNGRFYVEIFECDTNTGCNGNYDEDPNGCDNRFTTGSLTINFIPGEPQSVCGNGVVEDGEECDDGNNTPNDGCTNCTNDPEPPCAGDFDDDGSVGLSDFSSFLVAFGTTCSGCVEDIDGSGTVDLADFSAFLVVFGTDCP
ncbi:MAG: M12 family metallo-peptidase, partial [Phycisphaerales bacterium]|nr:M12 family metallo-peptidase [Phycisphaerales bacterium]